VITIAAISVLVGLAGYLGFRSAQPEAPAAIDVPPTVPVDRGDVQRTVTAPGRLIGTGEIVLSMGAAGRLAELNVRRGDVVRQGDVLARIDTSDLEAAVKQAELAYLKQQAIYSDTIQPNAATVDAAQAALSSAQANYAAAQRKHELGAQQVALACSGVEAAEAAMLKARDAYETTTVDHRGWYYQEKQQRKLAYEFARNAYDAEVARCNQAQRTADDDSGLQAALARLQTARTDLAQLTSPADDTIASARADLEQARLALEEAQQALDRAAIVAPFDGVVLEVNAGLGDALAANAGVIVLGDPSALEVQATIIEEDYPSVRPGQPVQLFFDVMPDLAVTGRVARVVPERASSDRPLYPLYIEVGEIPDGLLPGMTADASIVIETRSDVLRLPRSAVRVRSDGTARVEVWTGSAVEERIVQAGLVGDQHVEILDGLREGEQVVSR
jgi:HlyD family secretion protein